jgi:cellulose synthase/poly-beta-1,6-N-acetylglucosamine synthase-like glycosyltransferase
MIKRLNAANETVQRHAGKLLLVGLLAVAGHNWRLWQHDKALARKLRAVQRPQPKLSRAPKVSVLVAAWNEHDRIDAHLQSFLALAYPNIELILCAGGNDGTLAQARRYAGDRVIVLEQQPGAGKQRSLARCLELATGEIIYLTDADCLYNDEALARLLAPLINDGEQAATGSSRPLPEQDHKWLPRYIWSAELVASTRSGPYSEGLLGRNAALTRQALQQIGGLDFEAQTGTDYHLARRLIMNGTRIRQVSASVVPTAYPETLGSYWQKQARWMRNLLLYGSQYQAFHQVWATVRSSAIGAAMLAAPATFKVGGIGVVVVWLLLLTQACAAKLRYLFFAERIHGQRGSRKHILLLLPLTLVEFAIWVTPVIQVLHKNNRYRW